jgi:hypothetical protein
MSESCPTCGQRDRRPRSPKDHRRFFGAIAAAFFHWPEGHEFRPESAEHLRAWLLCKAGYHKVDVVEIPDDLLDDLPPAIQVTVLNILSKIVHRSVQIAKSDDEFAFEREHNNCVAVFKPRSIAFDTLDQNGFGALREAVEEVIEGELGITVDQLLKETERAA